MKTSLQPGIEATFRYPVTADMSPEHLPAKVLSTPSMIGLIERSCLLAAQAHLDEGETTVGTHVDVSHCGPAFPDEEISIHVRLQEVRKRRLDFAVEVSSARGSISSGRHERAVIDLARFGDAGAAR
ncbi:MAG TPA: hotdog domain-containing protein [Thermoanaerobaculia bacterium]|nr:hotdog domain-containing protein [Thermoanaerobaculia bacterium]